jgi:hypothetical protein
MQDKYNIVVLTVNIEFMWLDTKWMERLAKYRLSSVSKPRHIHSIFIVNTPILYISALPRGKSAITTQNTYVVTEN